MARIRTAFAGALVLALISAAAGAQTYSPPKTPWGDPDLQGIWSGDSAFGIPLQRPEALGTKAELTDKDFAEKVARHQRRRLLPQRQLLAHAVLSADVAHHRSPEWTRACARGRGREAPDTSGDLR